MFEQQERMLFNNELFIERFKFARKNIGASLNDLVKICSVNGKPLITKSAISLWENGKRVPTVDTLLIVCDIFAISMDWLVGYSEDMYKEDTIKRLEPKSFPVVFMVDDEKIELPINIPEDYVDEELRKSAYSLELRARVNYLILAIFKEYEFSRNFNHKKIKEYVEILNNIFIEKTIVVKKEDSKKVIDKNVDTIGSRLKSLRSDRGLPIVAMESLSSYFKKWSISGWERGSSVPAAIVIAEYARVFDVSTDWILGLTDERKP